MFPSSSAKDNVDDDLAILESIQPAAPPALQATRRVVVVPEEEGEVLSRFSHHPSMTRLPLDCLGEILSFVSDPSVARGVLRTSSVVRAYLRDTNPAALRNVTFTITDVAAFASVTKKRKKKPKKTPLSFAPSMTIPYVTKLHIDLLWGYWDDVDAPREKGRKGRRSSPLAFRKLVDGLFFVPPSPDEPSGARVVFPNVRHLVIVGRPKMRLSPGILRAFPSLAHLTIRRCFPMFSGRGAGGPSPFEAVSDLLTSLEIDNCCRRRPVEELKWEDVLNGTSDNRGGDSRGLGAKGLPKGAVSTACSSSILSSLHTLECLTLKDVQFEDSVGFASLPKLRRLVLFGMPRSFPAEEVLKSCGDTLREVYLEKVHSIQGREVSHLAVVEKLTFIRDIFSPRPGPNGIRGFFSYLPEARQGDCDVIFSSFVRVPDNFERQRHGHIFPCSVCGSEDLSIICPSPECLTKFCANCCEEKMSVCTFCFAPENQSGQAHAACKTCIVECASCHRPMCRRHFLIWECNQDPRSVDDGCDHSMDHRYGCLCKDCGEPVCADCNTSGDQYVMERHRLTDQCRGCRGNDDDQTKARQTS